MRRRKRSLTYGTGYCKRCQLMGTLHGGVCSGCLRGENPPGCLKDGEYTSLIDRSDDGRTKIVYRHAHRIYEVYTDGEFVGGDENRIAAYFKAGIPLPSEGW